VRYFHWDRSSLEQMFRIKDGVIFTSGVLVVVLSYAVGTLLGTVLIWKEKLKNLENS
jgi:hypothetical protein